MADPVQRLFTKIPALLAEAEALFSSDPDEKSLISTGLISQSECNALRAEVTLHERASAAVKAAGKTIPYPDYTVSFRNPELATLWARLEELRTNRRAREDFGIVFESVEKHHAFADLPIAKRIKQAANEAYTTYHARYGEEDTSTYREEVEVAGRVDKKTREGTHGLDDIRQSNRTYYSLMRETREVARARVMLDPVALATRADAAIVKETLEVRRNARLTEIGKRLLVCLNERAEPVEG